jgi:hypothetical protein
MGNHLGKEGTIVGGTDILFTEVICSFVKESAFYRLRLLSPSITFGLQWFKLQR